MVHQRGYLCHVMTSCVYRSSVEIVSTPPSHSSGRDSQPLASPALGAQMHFLPFGGPWGEFSYYSWRIIELTLFAARSWFTITLLKKARLIRSSLVLVATIAKYMIVALPGRQSTERSCAGYYSYRIRRERQRAAHI